MILKGNQRGGGKQLALHLLNGHENDHIEVYEVSGFVSDDLVEAFTESYAISQGTRCKQFLFSLSLNPPELETVPIEIFESAIDRIEQSLGLSGQPRAVVFHEKEGRRHAHCVWSRIDVAKMRAINHSHYKRKLNKISHELYLENQWEVPEGFKRKQERNPLNMDRAEWQQGKKTQRHLNNSFLNAGNSLTLAQRLLPHCESTALFCPKATDVAMWLWTKMVMSTQFLVG